jgi:hypothetical protein
VEFELDAEGKLVSGPTTLVEYVGTGRATVVGLAAGPDGLYFTDLYKDIDAATPIDPGARVYRVRYKPLPGDYDGDGAVEQGDLDLVLLHWGQPAEATPPGWINNLPTGTVGQAQLDAVLLNWGETIDSPATASSRATPPSPLEAQDATAVTKSTAEFSRKYANVDPRRLEPEACLWSVSDIMALQQEVTVLRGASVDGTPTRHTPGSRT